jgi:hypothetical protein
MLSTWPSVSSSSASPYGSQIVRSAPSSAAQRRFDLGLGHRRVAVGVHQALGGGDQRAVTVAGDRAALEHHVDRPHRFAPTFGEASGRRGIVVVGQELLAPRVELPVGRDAIAGIVEHVDRAGVAEPRVVDRQLDHLDRAAHRGSRSAVRGAASIVTGSNRAIALATSACAASASAYSSPHMSVRAASTSPCRSCGSHSAGSRVIANPLVDASER